MDRNKKVASLAIGAGLITLPFGGLGAAVVAAVAGAMVGNKQFPAGKKPWKEISTLLNKKESTCLEFKANLSQETKRKSSFDGIIKTVIGFANTRGGELLLGVSDTGKIVGIDSLIRAHENKDKFELAIRNALRSNIDGAIDLLYRMKFETIGDVTILRIEVEKSYNQVFSKNKGEFYVRDGNKTLALTPKEYAHRNSSDA